MTSFFLRCAAIFSAVVLLSHEARAGLVYFSQSIGTPIARYDTTTQTLLPPLALPGVQAPNALAFDSAGNLFIASRELAGLFSILKLTPDGVLSSFSPLNAFIEDLATDSMGNVFAVDRFAATIYKITPAGVTSVLTGGGLLSSPSGLTTDAAGNVYVANRLGTSVVKVTPSGATSLFSNSLFQPIDLVFDGTGNLAVLGGGSLVKIAPDGSLSTVAAVSGADSIDVDANGDFYLSAPLGGGGRKVSSTGVVSGVPGIFRATGVAVAPAALAAIPEPATFGFGLLLTGLALSARMRKRRK